MEKIGIPIPLCCPDYVCSGGSKWMMGPVIKDNRLAFVFLASAIKI